MLAFFNKQADWWTARSLNREKELDAVTQEGVAGYARKQAALRRVLAEHYTYLWRLTGEWERSEDVPPKRNWFNAIVNPRQAPTNMFQLVRGQSEDADEMLLME